MIGSNIIGSSCAQSHWRSKRVHSRLLARRSRRINLVGASFLFFLMACSAPMPEQPNQGIELGDLAYLTARLDWEADQLLDAGAASLTLAIFDADGVFWEKGYGLADVANEILAVPSTLYRVGSISKLFTATAIMQLVAKGEVVLDAPLTTYLPEFSLQPPPPILPGAAQWQLSDITIRSMLTHQSGIPTNVLKAYVSNHPIPFTDYVKVIRGWRAQAPVGLAFGYSNVAVTLLGHVVQRVSGVPFSEYIQKNILMPTGMPTSSFEATSEILATVARSYLAGDEIDAKQIGIIPAGALFSNVQELAAFGRMALRRGIGVRGRVLETVG
ncbi:MAG: beta-lactamase family protein, partial [Gammaproteobacteria bacterium]|nr:beta-lactamase family protein [Gammaproteobacteria bacterium]